LLRLVGFFVTAHPIELPPAYDRAYRTAALDVVVIERQINVNDDERDKDHRNV